MEAVLSKNSIEAERRNLLARLKNSQQVRIELVVDSKPNSSVDEDDGLTIPDFRKSLQR